MSACKLTEARRPPKLARVINYDWMQPENILIDYDTLADELTEGTSTYKKLLARVSSTHTMSIDEKASCILEILKALKTDTAQNRINKEKYNEIDMHFLTWTEALFIVKESIHDYSEALRKCPDMKGNITFVTGKGLHSKNGIPILKTSLEEYLKDMHIQHVVNEGSIKVYLGGFPVA